MAEIINADPKELFKLAKITATRYMSNDKTEEYGKRNSLEGELLIKNNANQSYRSKRYSRIINN